MKERSPAPLMNTYLHKRFQPTRCSLVILCLVLWGVIPGVAEDEEGYDPAEAGQTEWEAVTTDIEQAVGVAEHRRNFSGYFLIRVRDPEQRPISEAEVSGYFRLWADNPRRRERTRFEGETNRNGIFRTIAETYGSLDFSIQHPDFYPIADSFGFNAPGLRREMVMRPRIDPVPMSALRAVRIPFPDGSGPFGFDLVRMDWMPPHGVGEQKDLLMNISFETFSVRGDQTLALRADLPIQFTGTDNGIQPAASDFRHRMMSQFRSDYEAPQDGYRRQYRLIMDSSRDTQEGNDPANLWYFRIRSTPSPEGEPIGIYGKIYGPILDVTLQGAFLRFDGIYIQPVRGSRNMEFDLQNNRAQERVAPRWRSATHLNVTHP